MGFDPLSVRASKDDARCAGKSQTGQFQQRFWRENDAVFTSLMRKTAKGWEPNFPGSKRLAMSRTPV